jgi:hypothetical protein
MTDEGQLLTRAQSGDEVAFQALTESLRGELQMHCYRIVGSVQDAEDLVQETLVAAWRALEGFQGARVAALLAVPHRHEPLPEPPARPRAAAAGAAGARRTRPFAARADAPARAGLARALSGRAA